MNLRDKQKEILNFIYFALILGITYMLIHTILNLSMFNVNKDTVKNTVQYQINVMNFTIENLPNISKENKREFIKRELSNLYDIQKKDKYDRLEDVVIDITVSETTFNSFQAQITMLPSTHTCLFLQNLSALKSTYSVQRFDKEAHCPTEKTIISYDFK